MESQPRQKPTSQEIINSWLEYNFVGYQLQWILETSPFAIALKSRQIGFSDATAGCGVYHGFTKRRPQLVLSASQDLADEVLAKARTHCRTLARSGLPQAVDFSVDNATEIAWKTGGRIVALPANPRTARSFSGDVYLDEFAYHADAEGIRDGAFAMASRGDYRIRILSTPNGAQGLFYDWCNTPPEGWRLHVVTVDDAMEDGFAVDFDKLWRLCGGDERLFAQFYRCRFLDGDMQYIPTSMVNAARDWKGIVPPLERGEIHAGLDVGRVNDVTALVVVANIDGNAYVMPVMTCKRTKFRSQREMIRSARDMFQWSTLHVDATGIGAEMAEELVEEYGDDEVKPVHFTGQSKDDLCTRALRWFRDSRIKFPRGEDGNLLHSESISLRRQITNSGNVVYDIPRRGSNHGDRFFAMCLALKGAGEPIAPSEMGQSKLFAIP